MKISPFEHGIVEVVRFTLNLRILTETVFSEVKTLNGQNSGSSTVQKFHFAFSISFRFQHLSVTTTRING